MRTELPPFEFCAMRFLELWLRTEEPIHRGMIDPQLASMPDNLTKMLSHYSVQRNFPELENGNKNRTITLLLLEVVEKALPPVEAVQELTAALQNVFSKRNLSAASKLLWMRFRYPFVIVDRQAVNALQKGLNRSFDKSNYGEFFAVWNEEYAKRADAIQNASVGLVALPKKYTAAFALDDAKLKDLVSQRWFQARVFDIYLWEIGKS